MLPFFSPLSECQISSRRAEWLFPQEENAASRIAPRPSSFISSGLNNGRGGRRKVRKCTREAAINGVDGGARSAGGCIAIRRPFFRGQLRVSGVRKWPVWWASDGRTFHQLPYMCCVTVVEFDLPQLCRLSYCVIDDNSIGHIS